MLAACLLFGSGEARALGLGGLELSSNLNQPLQAHIPLRSVQPGDLDDLQIGLASREQFRRAGLDRPVVLSRLRFEIVDGGNGESFIRVSTKEPVREPFLNFLLEANWPQGRVIREYTVLLDPPVYGAAISSGVQEAVTTASELPPLEESASQSTQAPEGGQDTQTSRMARSAPEMRPEATDTVPEPESGETAAPMPAPEPDDVVSRDQGAAESMAAAPPQTGVEGAAAEGAADDAPQAFEEPSAAPEPVAKIEGDRMPGGDSAATGFQLSPGLGTYQVRRGDTLWSLAERYRPQDSVSVQQTMLAILSANPEAFAEANVNSLRAGAVLQVPELYDIALSKDEALAEVRRQNALWEEYRQAVTTQVAQAPEGLVDPGAGDDVTGVTSDDVTGDDVTGEDAAGDDMAGDDITGDDMAGDDLTAADDALDEDFMQDPLVADALGAEAAAALEDEDLGRLQVLATGSAVEQPEDTAKSGSERLQGLRNELNLTLEEMDAVRQQNEELRARLDQTHALVEDLKRLVELKDDNIAALQRRLGDLDEDTGAPETGSTPEPEPVLEEPAEPEAARDESAPEEMSPPEQQEPAPTTTDIPPPEPAAAAQEPTSTVATAEEPPESGEPQTGVAQPASGENLAMSGEAPSGDGATSPSEEEPAAGSSGGEGVPAEESVAGSSEVAGDADSSTETVAMVGETASPAGGSSGGSTSPKPSKPPAAPSFLESVLATLASFTGTAIEFGKSMGSVISSFIGSARESISLPELPTSLPSSLPVDPVMLGAAGGGVLLLGAGWMVMRRRRGGEAEAVEVELGIEDELEEPLRAPAPTPAGSIGSDDDAPAVGEASFGDEATGIVAAEGDDDPLAEVNVYMAYERFDQAEALVRDAIERFPDRHEYKLKLLEVAYAAKNLEVFEDGARALQDAVGADSTSMQKAVSWWQELSPDRELFAARSGAAPAADVETEDGLTSDINRIFDVTGGDAEVDSGAETQADERRSTNTDVDFDLGGDEDMSGSGMDADEVTGSDLDFDLGSVDQDEATGDQDLDFSLSGGEQPAPEAASQIDDPTVQGESFSLDTHVGEPSNATGSSTDAETGDDNSLDFDLSGIDLPQSDEGGGSEAAAEGAGDDDDGFDLGLDDNDTALGPVDSDEAAGQASAGDESGDDSLDFELEETYVQGGGGSLDAGFGADESDGDASMALETEAGEGDEGFDLSLEADDVETGEMEDQFDTVKLDDASFEGAGDDASGVDDSDVSLDLSESDGLEGYDELGVTEESAGEQQSEEQGEGFDLDLSGFDMEGEGADDAAQASGAVADAAPADDGEGEKTQYMLRDPGSGAAQGGSGVPFNEMSGDADAIQTKLDLALAYIDMGDSDGARSILDEVMVEGNDAQKKAAEDLLTKLD